MAQSRVPSAGNKHAGKLAKQHAPSLDLLFHSPCTFYISKQVHFLDACHTTQKSSGPKPIVVQCAKQMKARWAHLGEDTNPASHDDAL